MKLTKNQKIIAIVVIALIIIIGIVATSIYFINKNKDTDNVSQEKIVELYKTITQYNNIHYHIESETNSKDSEGEKRTLDIEDCYWRDNILVSIIESENLYEYTRIDFNSNETIMIRRDGEEKWISFGISDRYPIYKFGNRFSLEHDKLNWEYSYLGTETYNEKDVYKIKFNNLHNQADETYWMDTQTGLILREELNSKSDNSETSFIEKINYEFDTVTFDTIKTPNLNNYADYEIREN